MLVGRMRRRHFFHLKEWYESYLAALERNPEALLYCVVHDTADRSAPAALLPLQQKTRRFAGLRLRTLELPHHVHLHLRDILVNDAARSNLSLAEIARLLKRSRELRWDVLVLCHGLEDSCAMAAYNLRAPAWSICLKRFEPELRSRQKGRFAKGTEAIRVDAKQSRFRPAQNDPHRI